MIPLTLILLALCSAPQEPITYGLAYRPSANRVEVTLTLPERSAPQTLVMPRAIPMGYGEQPYDRYVRAVRAFAEDGRPLPVTRGDGPRWNIPRGRVARIEYAVDIARMEQEILSAADSSKVRPGYVGLLGYSVFAYLEGWEERPIRLRISAPDDWPILSTLAPQTPAAEGYLATDAADFYALADSQIAMGPEFRLRRLRSRTPLYLAVYAEGKVDLELIGRLAQETMDLVIDYFGAAPFPHYTVYQEYLRPVSRDHEYGFSMEHLDSGTFFLAADQGLLAGSGEREIWRTKYNLAHHFAHSWIPKRAYGEGYFPFTWELAPVLDSIWFSEGFAQYAAMVALAPSHPAGMDYVRAMVESRFRANLEQAPAFIKRMSLVELSRVASTRYSEDFRTGRNVFSRGGAMAYEMDLFIGEQTEGRKSLREGLRSLFAWSQEQGRAFRIGELPEILEAGTGVDPRSLFLKWMAPQGR